MSKTEWKEYKLSELLTIKYGKNQKAVEDPNGRIPIYGTGGLMGFASRPLYDKPSILIGRKGSIEKVRYVDHPFWTVDTLFYSEINKEIVLPKFLYYSMSLTNFSNYNEGTTIPSLRTETLNRLIYRIPSFKIQEKIVQILSSLDDKIELNNAINRNLEEQAKALFKNWFIDFEPFGGEMPSNWTIGKLIELCDFQEGYVNPAQTHNEFFDGNVKWLRAVDINESFIIETSRTLTTAGFESAGKSALLFKPNTIAISKSGTIGRLGIVADYMCGNRAVIDIAPRSEINLSFIHQYLKLHQSEFPDLAVGSVQKNLYISILENLDIIIPTEKTLYSFANILEPIYKQMKCLCQEASNLKIIRDSLLPKLMSGELSH